MDKKELLSRLKEIIEELGELMIDIEDENEKNYIDEEDVREIINDALKDRGIKTTKF